MYDQEIPPEVLLNKNQNRCRGIAYRIVLNRDDVEDIWQDVRLKWCKHPNYWLKHESEQQKLLYSITYHEAINWIRDNRHGQVSLGLIEDITTDPTPTIQSKLESREVVARIRALLREEPPRHREAFELKYFNKLTFADIAMKFGLPPSTVVGWIYQTRKRIKEQLSKENLIP